MVNGHSAPILSHLYKPRVNAYRNFVLQLSDMQLRPGTNNAGNAAPSPELYDVIISGAGPVGLFLASELALAGCSVLILEKATAASSPLKRLPFGIRGLSAPTIDALHRRGLLDELEIHKRLKNPHAHAVQGPRRQAGHFAGIAFHEEDIDTTLWPQRLPGAAATSLISEMEELETVLTRRAEALGVTIRRGIAVNGFQQTDEAVTVLCDDIAFTGKWLVGCDGSRSVVRKAGGFTFSGTDPEFTGYSVNADITGPGLLQPGRNVTSRGMYMQSQPGYLIIQDFDGGAFHSSGAAITREHIQEVLRRISGAEVTIAALHMATSWTDRARQATAYRNGRVLLAGDAAHIHAPLGGQGLNLGLGDAMNLGWKLAATIRGYAPEGLLDSYYTERYPIGEQVLDWSRAQVAIMKPDPHMRALYAVMRDLVHTRDGATYMAARVRGIFMHYEPGGDHPLTGYSIPGMELEEGTSLASLLHDGRGILLDCSDNAALQRWVMAYGHTLKYVTGRTKAPAGFTAALIRPDGIVAWACVDLPDDEALQKAADRWFLRDAVNAS